MHSTGTSHSASIRSVPREYVKADQLFSQGRYTEAIRLYQAVLSSSSHAISPGVLHTRIADSFFRLSDYQRALDAYRQALKEQKPAERRADPVLDRVLHLSSWQRRRGGDRILENTRELSNIRNVGRHRVLLGRQGERTHGQERAGSGVVPQGRREGNVHAGALCDEEGECGKKRVRGQGSRVKGHGSGVRVILTLTLLDPCYLTHDPIFTMLKELNIKNIAIIDQLRVEFAPGLNVFTGETGAGKSIVVDALNLALGERASADLIRTGSQEAVVEAAFELNGRSRAEMTELLSEQGIEMDPGRGPDRTPGAVVLGQEQGLYQREPGEPHHARGSGREPCRYPRPARAPVAALPRTPDGDARLLRRAR